MIEQLKTIQTGLAIAIDAEGFVDKPVRRALLDAVKAAAQLEAMVGEPVAWAVGHSGELHYFSKKEAAEAERLEAQRFSDDPIEPIRPLVFGNAAPVAQQHVPEADCGNIKAQQPQAEAVPDVVRDAQRWQVVQCDPNFRTSRWSEDADGWVYATVTDVDAAIAQQKGGV